MRLAEGEAGTVEGGCHCGAVRFTADLPEGWHAHLCNCTMCQMKGTVLVDVPVPAVTVTQGEDDLELYQFNTMVAKHHFCRKCGIHPFHQLRSEPENYGVNAVCLDGYSRYDFTELPVHDGQNHPRDNDGVRRWAGVMRYDPDA